MHSEEQHCEFWLPDVVIQKSQSICRRHRVQRYDAGLTHEQLPRQMHCVVDCLRRKITVDQVCDESPPRQQN